MAGIQDHLHFVEDFLGNENPTTSAGLGSGLVITDTSAAGTPTYTCGGIAGELTMAFDSTAEVQNVCLSTGDDLNWDIDKLHYIEMRVKMGQAAADAATSLAFGLASARNDAIDTIAEAALFRVIGADSTTAVVVETDDGTTNNDDVATGTTLINAYKKFRISFSSGTSDVRFYIDGARVAAGTTFDMSGYTAGLQPYVQLQKTADANTDSVVVDYISIVANR